jgi:hypothetical protein
MFFNCSPSCSDHTHQHFTAKSQENLADQTIASLKSKDKTE